MQEIPKIVLKNRILIHYPLCPLSRAVRMVLTEKNIDFDVSIETPWKIRPELLVLNPAGTLPILLEDNGSNIICDIQPIVEYIEDLQLGQPLFPTSPIAKAEVRRICNWFNIKFYHDVSLPLTRERIWKRISREGTPDSVSLRAGLENVKHHLFYVAHLVSNRNWLAGNVFSLADIVAAAHLSVVDFLDNIPWTHHVHARDFEPVRDWYARVKSRKSFRALLGDSITGFIPPEHYANPDF
jgi:glutathione S-transferase